MSSAFANSAGRKKLPRSLLVSAPPSAGEKLALLVTNVPPAEALTPLRNARFAGLK